MFISHKEKVLTSSAFPQVYERPSVCITHSHALVIRVFWFELQFIKNSSKWLWCPFAEGTKSSGLSDKSFKRHNISQRRGTSAAIKLSPQPGMKEQGLNWSWWGLTWGKAGAAGGHSTLSTPYLEFKISMSETFLKTFTLFNSWGFQLRDRILAYLRKFPCLVIDMFSAAVRMGQKVLLYIAGRNVNCYSLFLCSNLAISFKIRNTHTLWPSNPTPRNLSHRNKGTSM